MNSKTEKIAVLDCNATANAIMHDIIDIDRMEKMLSADLSSEDLFKIDCAILSSLRNTQDFSRNLLEQLEQGKFETVAVKPPKSVEQELKSIQQEAMCDITLPLQDFFSEAAEYVSNAFA